MHEKLKPCPFCGGQGGLVFEDVDYVGHEYAVQCNKCGIITEYYLNPIKAIEHFFTRYKDLEKGKWVKVTGWGSKEEAQAFIVKAVDAAKAK